MDMGISVSVLEKTHQDHYEASKKMEKDPDGGPWPAYPSGKTWDEVSGKTGSGKKFYHNVIDGAAVKTQPFFVAIITPVIHYCMGGLEIDAEGLVMGKTGPIKGLYCAGEVAGGVHGNNRLGGNSLLDCVVFGRVTGVAATKYILGNDVKKVNLKELTGGGLTGEVKSSKFSGGSYEDNMNESKKPAAAAGGATPAKKEKKEKKSGGGGGGFTLAEVAKHTTKTDCWVVVSGQVLNVTSFLSQHPGGELAILTFAGKDATEEFNMIHPPDVIPKYAPDAIIGTVGAGKAPKAKKAKKGKGGAVAAPAPPRVDKGDMFANFAAWGHYDGAENWRHQGYDHNPGVFLFNVKAYFHAFWALWLTILYNVCATIFSGIGKNIKISSDRTGLTRSAILLVLFMVIHGVGNLHVFMGPDDFNGYGYFYVRLYWTGFGMPANIVEEYILLSAVLHMFVGARRTWDKRKMVKNAGQIFPAMNLGLSGVMR